MRYRFIRFPEGRYKAVTLSYDDAKEHDRRLLEIIDQYHIKCTFNVNSEVLSDSRARCLTKEEIRDLVANGVHEVAVHGARHIALGRTTAVNGIREVLECRMELEKIVGNIVRGMAYADSGILKMSANVTYDEVRSYLKALGIVYARTALGDNNSFELPNDWYAWMPTCAHSNPRLFDYVQQFLALDMQKMYGANRNARLFYLWGHSYSFADDNNWGLLEEFCRQIGGKEDIWYATNIEICDYVAAYHSLVFSVENDIVYNPTVKKIWFDVDGKVYGVEPGQTLYI